MTLLSWAVLIGAAIVVIAVYLMSRRDKSVQKNWSPPPSTVARAPAIEQSDMFSPGKFDEFGVGKPRKRTAPTLEGGLPQQPLFQEPEPETQPRPRLLPGQEAAPPPPPEPAPAGPVEEKIFALLIAEREGTAIMGPKLHAALMQQNLQFGARKIYHRMQKGMVVFSVASLLKPGELDPAQAQGFSTPGLSVFLVLPGPVKPAAAFVDMVATARSLARSLNAEVFDSRKQVFTAESERAQKEEIENWARANRLA